MTPPLDKLADTDADYASYLEGFERLVESVPADHVVRSAEARRLYGDDFERELADLDAGRHPLQTR